MWIKLLENVSHSHLHIRRLKDWLWDQVMTPQSPGQISDEIENQVDEQRQLEQDRATQEEVALTNSDIPVMLKENIPDTSKMTVGQPLSAKTDSCRRSEEHSKTL